jgi:short subunit dehydrogenase-like uncharacterized protein
VQSPHCSPLAHGINFNVRKRVLGVLTLQERAREIFGRPAPRVKARLRKVKGGMSGGTAASAQSTLAAAARDPALLRLLTDPSR